MSYYERKYEKKTYNERVIHVDQGKFAPLVTSQVSGGKFRIK